MFTIVIPLYNKELSIKNTIESVLNQTCQDFEIIIINDGSTDTSVRVVEGIDDDRIRLLHQKNQGVSAARNLGVKEANNEWIAFIDGDDLWEANHLEEVIKMMNRFPNENVYVTSFEYSDKREMFRHPRKSLIFKIENYFKEAINEDLIWTGILVANKRSLEDVGGFDTKLNRGEDLDLWARLARKHTIIKSSEITAIYRIDAENRTRLNKKIEQTHVYYFKLESSSNEDEKQYYRLFILKRLYAYSRYGDITNVIKLKNRYASITWRDYLSFMSITLKEKLSAAYGI